MFLDWEWWKICLVALLIFLAFLFIHYIMKKINEARLEERYARLAQTHATNQGTQYEEHCLNSFRNAPTEEIKSPITKPRKQLSLVSNDNEIIPQDYRPQKETSIPKPSETVDLNKVVKKKLSTLPCSTNNTAMNTIQNDVNDNSFKSTSKHILANIVFPMSGILQNSEITTSTTEGITHQFKDKITENVLSIANSIGAKINQSNNYYQTKDMRDNKIFQEIVDNGSLKSNEIVTNIIEAVTNEFSEISQKTEEPIFEIESEREKINHIIVGKTNTEYNNQESGTPLSSQIINKSPLLSKIILPEEKLKVTTKDSEFFKTEISQAAVENVVQETSTSSLIKRLTSTEATSTQESTLPDDSKDDNDPTTTIGLVTLDVSQAIGKSLFHNKDKDASVTIASVNINERENSFNLKSSKLNTKDSETKKVTLSKDIIVKINSYDADPQTSKLKKKPRKRLPSTAGHSSKAKYARNIKSFWETFLGLRRK